MPTPLRNQLMLGKKEKCWSLWKVGRPWVGVIGSDDSAKVQAQSTS